MPKFTLTSQRRSSSGTHLAVVEGLYSRCEVVAMASSSTAAAGAAGPRHVSGLWLGEAVPAEEFADVPRNPIAWSLTLLQPAAVTAFGCGYFDDAADVPGQPVLFYLLRGSWDEDKGVVRLTKEYTGLPEG